MLYIVYLLVFTNYRAEQAQDELLEDFELRYGDIGAALPGEEVEVAAEDAVIEPVSAGEAFAALWFERDGERVLHDDTLLVVEGISVPDLRRGPGHYPGTAEPGQPGNVGISGHRTTYGAPFYDLDQLQPGDEVHLVDRAGREWVYDVLEQRVIAPTELWVVGDDPLETGAPMLTLTTCNPRFSSSERLVVFAELRAA
ncbi:MAG: sortase [Actinobacteria bacterium]|nr:sortase [Actinomycetota bacterium]